MDILFFFKLLIAAGLIALAAGAVSRALTAYSIKLAQSRQMLAEVNERSSHNTPTPRVGGIGLSAGCLVGLMIVGVQLALPETVPTILQPRLDLIGSMTWPVLAGMVIAYAGAFALGLWDDRSNPPAIAKLVGQIIISILPPLLGLRFLHIHVPGMESAADIPQVVGIIVTAAFLFLMMNVVNFMDGINGLAGRFGQFVAVGAFLGPLGWGGSETMIPLAAALWGANEGFLKFNMHDAKTFMGDCGSQPLGLMLGMTVVHLATLPTTYPVATIGALILVSVFVFDVIYTLIHRAIRGQNLMKAHREHLYQRYLIANGEDHLKTRLYVERYILATVIIGVLYTHLFWQTDKAMAQIVLIVAAGVALTFYAVEALQAEKKVESS